MDATRPFFTIDATPVVREEPRAEPPAYDRQSRTEEELLAALFQEDAVGRASESATREQVIAVRRRNTAAVRALKELYKDQCQATGSQWIFKKRDGRNYTEAHHLVPLGEGGADDPRNIIIVSPLFHRMLHHAEVGRIDLAKIQIQKDGTAALEVTINAMPYKITWHPEHARAVLVAR
jgi:5-methylcytosine-specific restriction protein A